jgi:hypothetical protein
MHWVLHRGPAALVIINGADWAMILKRTYSGQDLGTASGSVNRSL